MSTKTTVADLITAGLLSEGDVVSIKRKSAQADALITADGQLELEDGRTFTSPSKAAMEALGFPSINGWAVWKLGDVPLMDLREKIAPDERAQRSRPKKNEQAAADKLELIKTLKAELVVEQAWIASGQEGDHPETPNLDAARAKDAAERQAIADAKEVAAAEKEAKAAARAAVKAAQTESGSEG
jgi:hypothetical protein